MAQPTTEFHVERTLNCAPTYSRGKASLTPSSVENFWDPIYIGWIAALIEGEGSVLFMKSHAIVNISMTDEDVVRSIVDRLDIGRVTGPYIRDTPQKPIWRWTVSDRKSIARLLLAIYPLMGVRRRVAIEKIIDEIHELNRFLRPRPCKECNNLFQPNSFYSARRQIFCGIPCNQKWHRRKRG